MVNLIEEEEIDVKEYLGECVIYILCKKCTYQVAYFRDVQTINRQWIINGDTSILRGEKVFQFLLCDHCNEVVAERHNWPNEYKLDKKKLILKYY